MALHLADLESLMRASYIDFTTTGRETGSPGTVELSFALKGNDILCLAVDARWKQDQRKIYFYQSPSPPHRPARLPKSSAGPKGERLPLQPVLQ